MVVVPVIDWLDRSNQNQSNQPSKIFTTHDHDAERRAIMETNAFWRVSLTESQFILGDMTYLDVIKPFRAKESYCPWWLKECWRLTSNGGMNNLSLIRGVFSTCELWQPFRLTFVRRRQEIMKLMTLISIMFALYVSERVAWDRTRGLRHPRRGKTQPFQTLS